MTTPNRYEIIVAGMPVKRRSEILRETRQVHAKRFATHEAARQAIGTIHPSYRKYCVIVDRSEAAIDL